MPGPSEDTGKALDGESFHDPSSLRCPPPERLHRRLFARARTATGKTVFEAQIKAIGRAKAVEKIGLERKDAFDRKTHREDAGEQE